MSIIGVFVAKHIPSRAIGKISLKNKNKINKIHIFESLRRKFRMRSLYFDWLVLKVWLRI